MLTPANIRGKSFELVRNGFEPDEVSDFLAEVANALEEALKKNEENEEKIVKLVDKINEYREDEEAIKNALVISQKESNKIINDAKAQARDMIESAKTEQMRLSEQSAAECERIIKEHKETCAKLIKENTMETQRKIEQVRANYNEELARYEELKREVTLFKSELLPLYQKQLALIMQLPESEIKDEEEEEEEVVEEEPEAAEVTEDLPEDESEEAEAEEQTEDHTETEQEHINKILNTGSFEPVIPKENLQDLRFGSHGKK